VFDEEAAEVKPIASASASTGWTSPLVPTNNNQQQKDSRERRPGAQCQENHRALTHCDVTCNKFQIVNLVVVQPFATFQLVVSLSIF